MLALVHSAPVTLSEYRTPNLGVLSSPRRWYRDVDGWPWAADNDAYSGFDAGRYRAMLDGLRELPPPLFVTAPDVVADARATLDLFDLWLPELQGFPVALVAQDGLVPEAVPWFALSALFVGGLSEWKMGAGAQLLVQEAKERGLHVHMGRVNGRRRIMYAKAIGCDSFDGTSLSWFKDAHLADLLGAAAAPRQLMLARASP